MAKVKILPNGKAISQAYTVRSELNNRLVRFRSSRARRLSDKREIRDSLKEEGNFSKE